MTILRAFAFSFLALVASTSFADTTACDITSPFEVLSLTAKRCSADSQCPGSQICVDSICRERYGGCIADSQCPGSQVCRDGYCKERYGCTADSQCPGSEVCLRGECVPRF